MKRRLGRFIYLPFLMALVAIVLISLKLNFKLPLPALEPERDIRLVLWQLRQIDLVGQVAILLAGALGVAIFFKEKKNQVNALFAHYGLFVIMLMIAGLYCIIATFNLVRVLIGIELLIKAATLLLILVGYVTGRAALAQSLVITLIVIEVVIMVVAVGVILGIHSLHREIERQGYQGAERIK